jgi:hypothetical protein
LIFLGLLFLENQLKKRKRFFFSLLGLALPSGPPAQAAWPASARSPPRPRALVRTRADRAQRKAVAWPYAIDAARRVAVQWTPRARCLQSQQQRLASSASSPFRLSPLAATAAATATPSCALTVAAELTTLALPHHFPIALAYSPPRSPLRHRLASCRRRQG